DRYDGPRSPRQGADDAAIGHLAHDNRGVRRASNQYSLGGRPEARSPCGASPQACESQNTSISTCAPLVLVGATPPPMNTSEESMLEPVDPATLEGLRALRRPGQ